MPSTHSIWRYNRALLEPVETRILEPILRVNNIHKSFGALHVINDCSLEIGAGSITGLIGPNGAGKTTLFNLIAGAYGADSGSIIYGGEDAPQLIELDHNALWHALKKEAFHASVLEMEVARVC